MDHHIKMEQNYTIVEKFLWNFYIVDLKKTTFEKAEEVPNYMTEMLPFFAVMMIVESLALWMMGKGGIRIGDGITSVSLGLMMMTTRTVVGAIEMVGYTWLYEHRLVDLDWHSPWTWWIAALGVDLGYYWAHREVHEINLFWGTHQVHHSSEEYNLTTAFRQSVFQRFLSFGIYHPLALLGVPLPAAIVHFQFNLIFQIWMHTELIGNLGPLEWIFNTASHHRVHHGANKWCLDKNYAGFLIIWDKMFGTFEAERKDEPIVYGLVDQPQTYQPIYLQLFYFKKAFKKAAAMPTWTGRLQALFKGPGWTPGSPRLGNPEDYPDEILSRKKYSPKLSKYLEIYLLVHFLTCLIVWQQLMTHYATFSWYTALAFIVFVFFGFYTIGSFYDGHIWAPAMEAFRCIATVAVLKQGKNSHFTLTGSPNIDAVLLVYFALSSLIWSSQIISLIGFRKDMKYNLKAKLG